MLLEEVGAHALGSVLDESDEDVLRLEHLDHPATEGVSLRWQGDVGDVEKRLGGLCPHRWGTPVRGGAQRVDWLEPTDAALEAPRKRGGDAEAVERGGHGVPSCGGVVPG